ncbi:unnamed protein product, partial [Phaeothamnion confervicola]
ARFHSQSGPGAMAWLETAGTGKDLVIRDLPFQYAFRRALGIDQHFGVPHCPSTSCQQSPLMEPHCRLCSKSGSKGNRHTDIKDVLHALVQRAGLRTTREDGKPFVRFSDLGLRMDL